VGSASTVRLTRLDSAVSLAQLAIVAERTRHRPPGIGLLNGYMDALFQASFTDTVVRDTIIDVLHMVRRSTALFAPAVVTRVGLGAMRRRLGVAAGDGAPLPLPSAA
jgi:hypothetical protein